MTIKIDYTSRGNANHTAIRSLVPEWRLECRYCGWGDHNTAWHEQVEQQASGLLK